MAPRTLTRVQSPTEGVASGVPQLRWKQHADAGDVEESAGTTCRPVSKGVCASRSARWIGDDELRGYLRCTGFVRTHFINAHAFSRAALTFLSTTRSTGSRQCCKTGAQCRIKAVGIDFGDPHRVRRASATTAPVDHRFAERPCAGCFDHHVHHAPPEQ